MVTKKLSKPLDRGGRSRAPQRTALGARPGARSRAHSLAPPHLGDLGGVAILGMGILGVALLIVAVTMIVAGVTASTRFSGAPPPNAEELGTGQLLGGLAVLVVGLAEIAAVVWVVAQLRYARAGAVLLNTLVAVLGASGAYLVFSRGLQPDRVLAGTLTAVALVSAAAAAILARR